MAFNKSKVDWKFQGKKILAKNEAFDREDTKPHVTV